MKKYLAALLLAALCLITSTTAFAGGNQWVWETVNFRTSAANSNGYVDSSSVSNGATSFHTDTTIWISTADWAVPSGTSPTPDSTWVSIVVSPTNTGSATPGADSIYVFGETSNDATWAALGEKIEPMNLGGGQLGNGGTMCAVLLEDAGTNNTFRGFLHQATVRTGAVASGAVNSYAQLLGVPFIRFRLMSDATGTFRMMVGHYRTTCP